MCAVCYEKDFVRCKGPIKERKQFELSGDVTMYQARNNKTFELTSQNLKQFLHQLTKSEYHEATEYAKKHVHTNTRKCYQMHLIKILQAFRIHLQTPMGHHLQFKS